MPLALRLCLCLSLLTLLTGPAHAQGSSVGCQHLIVSDGLELGIWYPSQGIPRHQNLGPYEQDCIPDGVVRGRDRALIVISHGTGGSWTSHLDTAAALAKAGYVVVALTEPGDNWHDQSRSTDLAGRTHALSAALDYMLHQWPNASRLDQHRIGAFGFSSGGLTVLLSVGAKPILSRIGPWCQAQPGQFTCRLIARSNPPPKADLPDLTDHRIKAAAVAAPALGFTMDHQALAHVRPAIQLWQARDDQILPSPSSVESIRDALPRVPESHLVSGAGHFDFLAPCRRGSETLPICQSNSTFDRTRFHTEFNAELQRFFNETLRPLSDLKRGHSSSLSGRRSGPRWRRYRSLSAD